MLSVTPVGNKIICKEIKQVEEKTEAGVIKPVTVARDFTEAMVVKVGPDVKFAAKKKILFPVGAGLRQEFNNEEYIIIDDDSIWAVL